MSKKMPLRDRFANQLWQSVSPRPMAPLRKGSCHGGAVTEGSPVPRPLSYTRRGYRHHCRGGRLCPPGVRECTFFGEEETSMSQQRVCRALQESGDYLSGQELSRTLGISRAAVWKAVEALRRQGYDIEARTGPGLPAHRRPGFPLPGDGGAVFTPDSGESPCAGNGGLHQLFLPPPGSGGGPRRNGGAGGLPNGGPRAPGPQLPVPGRQGPVFLHPLAARLRPGGAFAADGSQRRGCLPRRSAGDRCPAADQMAQ